MGFTDNQIKAIKSSNCNVLVSAAAGSGKTTVLVERIIKRILDESNPIDIDRMLILTFTKAAASQMRDKILKAIEKKIEDDPENAHLAKQALLVHNAQISTFHGFCQEIIKNHFYEIDADPQMRVADEGEVKLMQMDVLEKLLEDAYEEGTEDFLNMVESYCTGKSDRTLEQIILRIHRISQAQPDPEGFLNECEKAYKIETVEELNKQKWFCEYVMTLRRQASEAVKLCKKMIMLCDCENGPLKYRVMYEDDLNYVEALSNAKSYDEMNSICRTHSKMKLATISAKEGVDDYLKEHSKKLRDKVYKISGDIEKTVGHSLEDDVLSIRAVAPLNSTLIRLARLFSEKYTQLKTDNGVIDFNDMEHLAIKILRNGDGVTAKAYRDKFIEIYVDEYQDSNLTQEELVRLISHDNVFMVGDVKQSIYRFRMARPDLFLEKYRSFTSVTELDETADLGNPSSEIVSSGLRIDLSDNFRSRDNVLRSINEIFFKIMTSQLGGIEYDNAASLHYGHLYDAYIDNGMYDSELILASGDDSMSDAECEAQAIATKINELVGKLDVVDDNNKLRKLRYSDIVILLRSMGGRDNVYRDVLLSRGIPAYVTTGGGYFGAREVEVLLNFLSVIDNPLQDIPLAAVLRSDIGRFTDEELAILRCKERKEAENKEQSYLYDNLLQDDSEKSKQFILLLNHYRNESDYLSVYEILQEIIDGEYGDIVRSSHNGKQAEANLNMLLKKAEDFGKLSYKGLFHFLRYIDQIRKYEIDYGEAGITDESDNNVRIMTIHKSKGLEFPVVFVSALSKKRNFMDERAEIITDSDLGLGLNHVDLEKRVKKSTIIRNCMISRLKSENVAEEIRILYVALTRAKEKLIMVAKTDDAEKDFYNNQKTLSMCESYLDMLAYAYIQEEYFKYTHVIEMHPQDYIFQETNRQLRDEDRRERLKMLINADNRSVTTDTENKIACDIKGKLDSEYSHGGEMPEYAKLSVSELKKASMEEAISRENGEATEGVESKELIEKSHAEKTAYVPDFIREAEDAPDAGTFYGTAFHRMAELWNYAEYSGKEESITEEIVSEYFEKMCESGRISRIQLDAVRTRELVTFLRSNAAKRMGEADKKGLLFKEQPFTLGIDPGPMLVQGIIDVYWIEDGEIVILDYKTDRVSTGKQLVDRYHVQLEYYDMALNQLLDLPVREKIIYSTRLKEEIAF